MELDTNNHSVFLLYYHLVLVTKRDFPQVKQFLWKEMSWS